MSTRIVARIKAKDGDTYEIADEQTREQILALQTAFDETKSKVENEYLTKASAANTYLTKSNASSTYAPKASPTLTGTPTAPTAATGTSNTQIATTAFATAVANNIAAKASMTLLYYNMTGASKNFTLEKSLAGCTRVLIATMSGVFCFPVVKPDGSTDINCYISAPFQEQNTSGAHNIATQRFYISRGTQAYFGIGYKSVTTTTGAVTVSQYSANSAIGTPSLYVTAIYGMGSWSDEMITFTLTDISGTSPSSETVYAEKGMPWSVYTSRNNLFYVNGSGYVCDGDYDTYVYSDSACTKPVKGADALANEGTYYYGY